MRRERGFHKFVAHLQSKRSNRYIASCSSCRYMVDSCTHSGVLSYDIVESEDGRVYCTYWQPEFCEVKRKKMDDFDF